MNDQSPSKPTHDPFRQPGVVVVTFVSEEPSDSEHYIHRLENLITKYSHDNVARSGYTLTIYPRAVND